MVQSIAEATSDGEFKIDHDRVSVLLSRDGEPMFEDAFLDAHPRLGACVLDVGFSAGRDWNPDTDERSAQIRTQPDPSIKVYDNIEGDGHFVLLCINGMDAVYTAFYVAEEVGPFLATLVASLEESFEGIDTVSHRILHDDTYQQILDDMLDMAVTLLSAHLMNNLERTDAKTVEEAQRQAKARVHGGSR